jgi:hypothetical protein
MWQSSRKRFETNVSFEQLVENIKIDLEIFSNGKLYYLEPGKELEDRVFIDSIEKAKQAVGTAKSQEFDHFSVIFAFPTKQNKVSSN